MRCCLPYTDSADADSCCPAGKLSERDSFAPHFSTPLSERAHILRCHGSVIFLYSFCGIPPHWSLHFLPVLTGRKRSKGRNSRPRFRPKISPRRLPPRNSLPAVAQTSAPASRRPVKILPCGPASNGMGGELNRRSPSCTDGANFITNSYRYSCTMRTHIRRCRGSCISPPRRGSPDSVLLRHMMPWSLHFTARKRKVAKKRGRRPGEKSLSPERRSAQPVIPCQRISGLNVSAIFRRDNTGCGTRPGVRSPDGAPCAATGIFLMAGVTQPLTHRAANTVRRLKNKKAAHTVRPAPTPGPLTLTLAFPIHFDNRIKEITRLRTLLIYSPEPAPSVYYRQ